MTELTVTTAYALADGAQIRLQVYTADGQILCLILDDATREATLRALQRAARVQRADEIASAPLRRTEPAATRIDGWEI